MTQGPAALTAAGGDRPALAAAGVQKLRLPAAAVTAEARAAGAGQNRGAALLGVERVQDHEAGIVDPAVGIFEGTAELGLERGAGRVAAQVERAGRRQALAAAKVVVEEQAEADQPSRALFGRVRQDEAHRPDDVRGGGEQHLALDQRLAHEAELVIFEVAQAAMDQLAAARAGALGEVVLLAQQHPQAAAGGVAGDAGAVDAAADDQEVVVAARCLHRHRYSTPNSCLARGP